MSAVITPDGKSGEATKQGHLILGITATRTVAGVHVEMKGGGEIRKLYEACSIRDGMPRPKLNLFGIEGLNVWLGGYEIENIVPCQVPNSPQFGVWVIRHCNLGIEDTTSFTLPVPHSQSHIKATIQAVVNASREIFRNYATKVVASGEARTEPGSDRAIQDFASRLGTTSTSGRLTANQQRQRQAYEEAYRLQQAGRHGRTVIPDPEPVDPQFDRDYDDEEG